MDSHPLVKLAHILHRVYFAIIKGQGWLLESLREYSPFNVACERWFGELIQCPAHGIVSQAPRRWAFTLTLLVVPFFMREGLAWRSSQSLPIVIIAFIIGGHVRARMRSHSLCMAQLSLQVIYLSLYGLLIILALGYVTAHTRVASASLSYVRTSLLKPSILFTSITFRVGKVTLLLGFGQFKMMGACSVRAWSCHAWSLLLLTHKFFPQMAPIVRTRLSTSTIRWVDPVPTSLIQWIYREWV